MPCGWGLEVPVFVPEKSFELQLLCSLRRPNNIFTVFETRQCSYRNYFLQSVIVEEKSDFEDNRESKKSVENMVDSLVSPHAYLSCRLPLLLPSILAKANLNSPYQESQQKQRCMLAYLDADLFCHLFEFLTPPTLFAFGSLSCWWFASLTAANAAAVTPVSGHGNSATSLRSSNSGSSSSSSGNDNGRNNSKTTSPIISMSTIITSGAPSTTAPTSITAAHRQEWTELFSLRCWKKLCLLFLRPVFAHLSKEKIFGTNFEKEQPMKDMYAFLDHLQTSQDIRTFLSCSGILFFASFAQFSTSFRISYEHGVLSFPIPLSCGGMRRVLCVGCDEEVETKKEADFNEGHYYANQEGREFYLVGKKRLEPNVFERHPGCTPIYLYMPIHLLRVPKSAFGPFSLLTTDVRGLFLTPSPPPPPPLLLPSHRFSVDLRECLPLYLKFLKRSSLRWELFRDFMQTNKLLHLLDRSFCFLTMLQDVYMSSSSSSSLYPTDSVLVGLHILLLDNKTWYQIALSRLGYLPKVDFGVLLKWNASKQRSTMLATAKEFQRRFGYGDYLEGEGKPCQEIAPHNEPVAITLRWKPWFSGLQQLGVKRLAQSMADLCNYSLVNEGVLLDNKCVKEYTAMFENFGVQRRKYLLHTHKLREEFRLDRAREAERGVVVVEQEKLVLPPIAVPDIPLHIDIVFHLHLLHSSHFYYDCMRELGLCVIHDPYAVQEPNAPQVPGLCSVM